MGVVVEPDTRIVEMSSDVGGLVDHLVSLGVVIGGAALVVFCLLFLVRRVRQGIRAGS